MSSEPLDNWLKKSAEHQKQYKQFLSRAEPRKVINQLPGLHEEAFAAIN
jgi:hypothetical protein